MLLCSSRRLGAEPIISKFANVWTNVCPVTMSLTQAMTIYTFIITSKTTCGGSWSLIVLYRISRYLYLWSCHIVQQQGSGYSDTSNDAVLHLPETHQERHSERQQVQLCGGYMSESMGKDVRNVRKEEIEPTPTAYPPDLSHGTEIDHGSDRTDDDRSETSFGDVVESRHEERQGK